MTRGHASGYAPPADPYEAARCPDCRHLRYADEAPGAPCRWCGPACANHGTPLERIRGGEAS
jgi:hypothetical protein